jgi:hypothetical protein
MTEEYIPDKDMEESIPDQEEVTPVEEEVIEKNKIDEEDKKDLSFLYPEKVLTKLSNTVADFTNVLSVVIHKQDNIINELNDLLEVKKITAEEVKKAGGDDNNFIKNIFKSNILYTDRQSMLNKEWNNVEKDNFNITDKESEVASKLIKKFNSKGQKLEGKLAKLALIAKTTGYIHNPLFHSGFWVKQIPIPLPELYDCYVSIDTELNDFGRIYTVHSLSMGDILVQEATLRIIHKHIVDSNLEGWEDFDTFISCLVEFDFDLLLLNTVRLMFRDGIDLTLSCLNPECIATDNFNINFADLRLDNLDKLDDKAIEIMMSDNVTPEQLVEYRAKYLPNKKIKLSDSIGMTFKPAVISDRFSVGVEIVKLIQNKLKQNKKYNINDLVSINFIKIIKPWVKNVLLYDEETEELEGVISDFDDIVDTFSTFMTDNDSNITEELIKYKSEIRMSFVGHKPFKCKKCNHETKEDYLQIGDIQSIFFIVVYQLLTTAASKTI